MGLTWALTVDLSKGDVTLTYMLYFQTQTIEILFKFNTMVWNVVALSSVKSGPTFQT